jgi:hypothetical protein
MDEISFALGFVPGKHAVDVTFRASKGEGSPVLVSIWVVC